MAEEWLSITDAAKRLSAAGDVIDRSTLSRYLRQHAEALPTRREGKSNLVEFGTLQRHRGENIRLVQARRVEPAPDLATAMPPDPGQGQPTQVSAAARDKEAQAALRELDLARELKQVTPVREVAEAGQAAIVLMRNAFERAVEAEAQALAMKYGWDERQARLALKSFSNAGLDVFHRTILERLGGADPLPGDGDNRQTDRVTLQ
jgi:hypothetical protein